MNFLKVACYNTWQAILGAGTWSILWFTAMFASTIAIEIIAPIALAVQVSALSLTFALVSRHFAKLISYAIGSDTDFRHLFMRDRERQDEKPHYWRLGVSFGLLASAIWLLISQLQLAIEPKPHVTTDFFRYSLEFFRVILCIFAAQIIFSWPDPETAQ